MADAVTVQEKAPLAAPVALPTPDDLFVFLERLRHQGYRIDAGQIAAVERLLLDVHVAGPDSPAARRLKFRLAPVIAKTPEEQEDFYRQFDQWRGPLITATPAPRPTTPGPATEVTRRDPRRLIIAGAVVTCIGLSPAATWYFWRPPAAVPQAETYSPPSPGEQEVVSPFYDGLKTMLMAAPMLAFAAWLTLCWRRRALWLSHGIDVLDAELATVPLPVKLSQALFVGREFRDSAQSLRKHRYCPTRQLDVRKTANATAAHAGLFYPVYRERPHCRSTFS